MTSFEKSYTTHSSACQMDIWSSRYHIFLPRNDGGGEVISNPNLETLAGDDGGGGIFWPEMISSPEMTNTRAIPL